MNSRRFNHFSFRRLIVSYQTRFFVALLLFTSGYGLSYCQSAVDHSGILSTAGVNDEQLNCISIKLENPILDSEAPSIETELKRYNGVEIVYNKQIDGGSYVYVKYTNEISINQILAVLKSIGRVGHYLNSNGDVVTYYHEKNIYILNH